MEYSVPRRTFLQGSSALGVLAGLGMVKCQRPETSRLNPDLRVALPEPGPMIPPVPAILLTVNGRPGDPDEISVVWTFVINGSPPQVGITRL